jgi:hypothetical protein
VGFLDKLLGRAEESVTSSPALHPEASAEAFTAQLSGAGLSLDSLGVSTALDQMIAFYLGQRCDRCDPDADGDMLLFQWGVFDWGRGPSFQFNLTRQFTIADALGDEGMSQLSLTLHFEPADALAALGKGNQWCTSPAESAAFARSVKSSAAFAALIGAVPSRAELDWGGV